jgi:4-hydroxyphenylacetate 3-monooxygenase
VRRLFSEAWAEATFGLSGPHARSRRRIFRRLRGIAQGVRGGRSEFRRERRALLRIRVSYAIVPPQVDRGMPPHQQSDPTLYAGVVKERDDGIVISGSQQLATAAVSSDWLQLACTHSSRVVRALSFSNS